MADARPRLGVLYLTYHDFAGGFPIIERSTDGGRTFTPCGTIIDPGGPAAQNYTPTGGTLVSKPVIGKDGTVFVEFTEPDGASPPVGASLNHMYMAVAKGGCEGGTVFENHVVYEDPGRRAWRTIFGHRGDRRRRPALHPARRSS